MLQSEVSKVTFKSCKIKILRLSDDSSINKTLKRKSPATADLPYSDIMQSWMLDPCYSGRYCPSRGQLVTVDWECSGDETHLAPDQMAAHQRAISILRPICTLPKNEEGEAFTEQSLLLTPRGTKQCYLPRSSESTSPGHRCLWPRGVLKLVKRVMINIKSQDTIYKRGWECGLEVKSSYYSGRLTEFVF